MITVISYIVTILLSQFLILDYLSLPVTLIVKFITRVHLISVIIGLFFAYLLLDFLWIELEGNNIPIVLLVFILFMNHMTKETGQLTKEGKTQNQGDQLAVLLYIIKLLFFSDTIRWY